MGKGGIMNEWATCDVYFGQVQLELSWRGQFTSTTQSKMPIRASCTSDGALTITVNEIRYM